MNDKHARHFNLLGVIILIGGLLAATVIYLRVPAVADGVGYTLSDGESYAIAGSEAKRYRHDLQLFGGSMSLLMDDFKRWFVAQWHGKRLANSIAWLSILLAIGCFQIAHRLSNRKRDSDD